MQSGDAILQARRHRTFDVVEAAERVTYDLETELIGAALQRA